VIKFSKRLKIPTYNCEINIIITDEICKEVNKIYKKHKQNEIFNDTVEGIVITIDLNTYYLLLDTKYLTHNTIAHEVYHSIVRVTGDRGIEEEEAQAWLGGHMTSEIYKFIEKKKLIVTHGR